MTSLLHHANKTGSHVKKTSKTRKCQPHNDFLLFSNTIFFPPDLYKAYKLQMKSVFFYLFVWTYTNLHKHKLRNKTEKSICDAGKI